MKQNKSEFFGKDRSELIVRYVIEDVFELPFDLRDVHCWMVEYGFLYVKHSESDDYIEYSPSFNYIKDSSHPFQYPDMTLIKSYKNGNPI